MCCAALSAQPDVCVERTEVAAALYASQFHSLSRRSLFAEVQLCCDRACDGFGSHCARACIPEYGCWLLRSSLPPGRRRLGAAGKAKNQKWPFAEVWAQCAPPRRRAAGRAARGLVRRHAAMDVCKVEEVCESDCSFRALNMRKLLLSSPGLKLRK